MRYEEFTKIQLANLEKAGVITSESMPDLELYIDQIADFFEKKLSGLDDKIIKKAGSKGAINEYVKRGIPKPEKKLFNKDHFMMIAMVIYLRGLLDGKDVETLMKPLAENYGSEFDDSIDPAVIYDIVIDLTADCAKNLSDTVNKDMVDIKKALESTDIADDDRMEILIMILTLTIRADMEKLIARKLIEEYFEQPAKEKPFKMKKIKRKKD